MRIPHIISKNTIVAYELSEVYLQKEQVKCYDFNWDNDYIKTLRELCLITIAKYWERNPLYKELVLSDKLFLLELLQTDLPLELTVPIITDDYYWQRCFMSRWPDSPQPNFYYKIDKPIYDNFANNVSDIDNVDISNYGSDTFNYAFTTFTGSEAAINKQNSFEQYSFEWPKNTFMTSSLINTYNPSNISDLKQSSFNKFIIKTWKQCFLERYLEEEIARIKPDTYNIEHISDLTDLCGDYILSLNIKHLQASKYETSNEHVSLYTLLSKLPNLIELTICFNQGNIVDKFSWHLMKISEKDCELLGKGVTYNQLQILRVHRSDINCAKVKLIAQKLCESNNYLRVLDLSHCKIADKGAKALAGMLAQYSVLEKLILANNQIGADGAQALAFYLVNSESKLIELNLKLNPLKVEGGKYIATALARGAHTLQNLNISSCGLTDENIFFGLAFKLNQYLQRLDLSNNRLGEGAGEIFLRGLENNTTIIHLDLRMCNFNPNDLEQIQVIIKRNLKAYRKVLKTPPSTENII